MKRMNRVIAAIISAAILITAFGSVSADAAMVKRFDGIIKTEFWMTSYHFKDDNAHHPDIQCQALYFSNGMIEVYFWNVRQYDESYDEEKIIILDEYEPVSTAHEAYQFKVNGNKMIYSEDEVELIEGYNYRASELLTKRVVVDVNDDLPTFSRSRGSYSRRSGRYSRRSARNARRTTTKSTRSSRGGSTVTIQRGQTLSQIAKRNGTTVAKLRQLNGIKGNNIRAGKKIRVK